VKTGTAGFGDATKARFGFHGLSNWRSVSLETPVNRKGVI
jgi:hypothetical protein